MIKLNSQQRDAVDKMHDFVKGKERMFLLEGYAGTGKTTCVQTLIRELPCVLFALSAPTNKATKVLREMSEREGVEGVACRTIYSLLGLRVTKDSEFVQVEPTGECDATNFNVVIVDEASMINEKLFKFIQTAAADTDTKFIFMGDPLQLPPVGESRSLTLTITNKASLTKVERHDNQILSLATRLRESILAGEDPSFRSDNDENGGVWCVDSRVMRRRLEKAYSSDSYALRPGSIKTIAWRNATVGHYNSIIRSAIYGEKADKEMFVVDERVVTTHPITELGDSNDILMVTDEEANVLSANVIEHPLHPELKVYSLKLETEFTNSVALAMVVHPDSEKAYSAKLADLAEKARSKRISWAAFWDMKHKYFHDVRPCHAITAHRSQGSTYESAFIDVGDVMANRNYDEAMRCLYVAVTRASKILVLRTR